MTTAAPCAVCGNVVSPLAKYCPECGAATGRPRPDLDQAVEGELRQLTVVFCDLVGSTELSTRMDPEEFGDVIHRYLQRAAAVIRRFEGDVARYLGDGILAQFGWPEAHDDDAERAVRAALDVVAEVQTLNGELPAETQLAVRIGIHTGPVMIDAIRGAAQETISLGETLNVAARLQTIAPPNGVVLSGTTRDLVHGIFVIEDFPPQALKGIREPVPVYRAVQPTGVRSRLDARGKVTPLVGREQELSTLRSLWRQARSGRGRAALITGDAGVGKSRLAFEFHRKLREEPHSWLECRCSSYTRQSAFRPVVELIQQGLQIRGTDSQDETLAKLERGLKMAGVTAPAAVELVAPLLGIALTTGTTPLGASTELRRRKTIELLVDWVLALAGPQPMVLLVEDLHWADPSSLALFDELLARAAHAQLMILATARPELGSTWRDRSGPTVIDVSALPPGEAMTMASTLSPGGLPVLVLDKIVAQADGIPLYIEELGRMLLDSMEPGRHAADPVRDDEPIEIPPTLQASLMARLDRLGEAKRVAQRAAVIGREFHYELLEEVAGVDRETLQVGLARLVEGDLLLEHGQLPQATYAFRHALIQDAAYRSVLRRTRTTLHERIAQSLERRSGDDAAIAPEVIARHFEAARRPDAAAAHYRRAARHAAESFAHREAITHLEKAIELVRVCPAGPERDAEEIDLQIELGSSLIAIAGYADPKVRAAYARALELCEAHGDGLLVGQALAGLSLFHTNGGETRRGEQLARRVLEISQRAGDDTLELLARVQLAVPACYQGRFAEALEHCDRALEIYDPERDRSIAIRFGTDHGVAAHGFASLSLCFLGQFDAAFGHVRTGLALARSLRNPFDLSYALLSETVAHWMRGDLEAERSAADQLVAVSEEQGFDLFTGIGRMCRGAARAMIERDEEALAEIVEGGMLAARTGLRGAVPCLMGMLAEAQLAVGRLEEAGATLEAALGVVTETDQWAWEPRLLWLKGCVANESREPLEAEEFFRRSLEIARSQGGRTDELRAVNSLADPAFSAS
jgi:class 3 adenylate cyclase/tetratricopeptide (TPR) repeat protein